jgi:hypothetical protein
MKRNFIFSVASALSISLGWIVLASAGVAREKAVSRAYAGHENDRDIQNFIRHYPKAAGTRLDDCQTCHRSGIKGTDTEREFSPCGYCHLLQFPKAKYKTGIPENFEQTLNPYGIEYKRKGRTLKALAAISNLDSDGDGFANAEEIDDMRNPGDAASKPGQPMSPIKKISWNDIRALPRHDQFMLMNASHDWMDEYVVCSGVRILDLLQAAGTEPTGADGITVFAPDGYSIDYAMDEIVKPFPNGFYYAGPKSIKDKDAAFVRYPESIPSNLSDGGEIPVALWLLLAYESNGELLEASAYEKGTGRLRGEGPYRLIRPQKDLMGDPAKAGRPDRSVKAKAYGDGWDYSAAIDHNAGFCVRGATVIRINPVPAGFEEYDWKNSWSLVSDRAIVIYGHGIYGK